MEAEAEEIGVVARELLRLGGDEEETERGRGGRPSPEDERSRSVLRRVGRPVLIRSLSLFDAKMDEEDEVEDDDDARA